MCIVVQELYRVVQGLSRCVGEIVCCGFDLFIFDMLHSVQQHMLAVAWNFLQRIIRIR